MSILNNFWQCSSVGADVLISSGGGGGSVQFHSSNLKKLTTLLDFFQNSQVISTTLCTYKDTKKKKVNIRGELKKKWTGFRAYNSCSWAAIIKWQSSVESYYIYNPRDFKYYQAWHPLVVQGVCKNNLLKLDETFCTWKSNNKHWKWRSLQLSSSMFWPRRAKVKVVQKTRCQ